MRVSLWLLSSLSLATVPAAANAGVFSQDLSRCLITKSCDQDRTAFMAWMFSAIASDPKLASLTTLDTVKRDRISASAAAVFQRLVTADCRAEAIAAAKNEGGQAFATAFGEMGRAAAQQLFQSPAAAAELENLSSHFDKEKLEALGREAGIASKSDK